LHAVKMTQNWALLTPPLSRAAGHTRELEKDVPLFNEPL
jgi:hypothetical protein